MLKITRETDYSIVLLSFMAQTPDMAYSASHLAKDCHLPLPMVSKILKALTQANLLLSQRGAQGGYSLARSANSVSVADIIEAIEGPIAMTDCSIDEPDACAYLQHCHVSNHWNQINDAIRDALQKISLDQMSHKQPAATANTATAIPIAEIRIA